MASESPTIVKVKIKIPTEADDLTKPRKSKLFFEFDVFIPFHATVHLLCPL